MINSFPIGCGTNPAPAAARSATTKPKPSATIAPKRIKHHRIFPSTPQSQQTHLPCPIILADHHARSYRLSLMNITDLIVIPPPRYGAEAMARLFEALCGELM
jgi:hypothetical protein